MKKPTHQQVPPSLANHFLHWFLKEELAEEVEGDLTEQFDIKLQQTSPFKAKINYWYQVLMYLRPFAMKHIHIVHIQFNHAMFRNYLTIGWRSLFKQKGYSFINISGLAVGMAVAMLIGLWIFQQLTYNKQFDHYDRIAKIVQNQTYDGEIVSRSGVPYQLATVLRDDYGDYFDHVIISLDNSGHILSHGEQAISSRGSFMETGAADMLSLTMLEGIRDGLQDMHSILLSESTATAIFGDEPALSQTLKIDDAMEVKVTGVYQDMPANGNFNTVAFIAPWELVLKNQQWDETLGWGNNWFDLYVQLGENANLYQASAAIKNVKKKYVDANEGARFNPELLLHPMERWHLYSNFENGVSVGGRIDFVWLVGIIGAFVLALACINFMNLSTARSGKRAKEVGVRKVIGSVRSQLITQFFSESILIAAQAFLLALLLVQFLVPVFNEMADSDIIIPWANPVFWLVSIGFTLFTGLLAGTYPALYLSSFGPVKVLKGTFKTGRKASIPRKVLVVVQFTISLTLIIGTIIVFQQIRHAQNRPVGYDREGLVYIPLFTEEGKQHFETLRQELLATGLVSEVAKTQGRVTDMGTTNGGFIWQGKDPNMQDEIITLGTSYEFGNAINWEIVQGRDFSRDFASDSLAFILNETAVDYMGFDEPIGQRVKAFGKEYTVIGVVRDMVSQSLYQPVKQSIFYIDQFNRADMVNVKIHPEAGAGEALAAIEKVYKTMNPTTPFEYEFADDDFARKFEYEARIGKVSGFFAVLAIFISCLGLFGMASYAAEQRTKEIGIRKVLGATVAGIWQLLSRDFMLLIFIACVLSVPLAYYFLSQWLAGYEYRIQISWWVFVITAVVAFIITILTVSYQTIKAALMNPVSSLRSE